MSEPTDCECSASPTLMFACSGAADVGEVSDLAAGKLNNKGAGKMFFLAGVGRRATGIKDKTNAASRILATNGYDLDCARLTLQEAGIRNFSHLRVTDLSMEKGQTAVTPEAVTQIRGRAESLLSGGAVEGEQP